MEEFEFSNNAINVLNSIFSAVMGIAYPLIIQAIERLDEKYDSPRIAKMWRTRQTLWEECTDANPKLSLNDT